MSDILLLVGVALAALSVLLAIMSLARTEPPRGAAITLILGIALVFGGAKLSAAPLGVDLLTGAWQRLMNGQITLDQAPAETPVANPSAATTEVPAAAPAEAPAAAAAETPAETAPSQ